MILNSSGDYGDNRLNCDPDIMSLFALFALFALFGVFAFWTELPLL